MLTLPYMAPGWLCAYLLPATPGCTLEEQQNSSSVLISTVSVLKTHFYYYTAVLSWFSS